MSRAHKSPDIEMPITVIYYFLAVENPPPDHRSDVEAPFSGCYMPIAYTQLAEDVSRTR